MLKFCLNSSFQFIKCLFFLQVCELIVEYNPATCLKATPHPVSFSVTPDSLRNVKERQNVPRFLVKGKFDSTMCCISKPFTGELVIEYCNVPVKSVELQLVRVETCGCAEGFSRDGKEILTILFKLLDLFLATEIQNIQIGEGDVMCGIAIPVYMVFPRLFTCPTLCTSNFKVGKKLLSSFFIKIHSKKLFLEFEVNVVIIFEDNHLITENFPIVLTRG